MGERLQNIAKLFKDARTRTIILITGGTLLFAVLIGIYIFNKFAAAPPTQVTLPTTPQISATPGSFEPNPEYVKLQEEENIRRAQEAAKTGQSHIPTIIKFTKPGEGEIAATATPGTQPWQAGLGFQQLAQIGPMHTPKAVALTNLKNKCDPENVKMAIAAGASVQELFEMGCSPEQLLKAGINICDLCVIPRAPHVPGLPVGITAQQLKAAGCDSASVAKAKAQGVSAEALKALGCSAEELKDAGFGAEDLKDAGFNGGELIKAGFAPKQLKDAGFSATDLAKAGLTSTQLKDAGFNDDEINSAVAKLNQGLPEGVTFDALKAGDCTPEALKKFRAQGVNAETMKKLGCTAAQLKAGRYTAEELKDAGFSAGELLRAGFTPQQLKQAGFTAPELKSAGLSAKDLKAAGFTAQDLKNAGFLANELANAGFSPEDIKQAGFSPTQLKNAEFNAEQLKRAGLTAAELRAAGFSADDLKNAGFTPQEMMAAGIAPPVPQIPPPPPPPVAVQQPTEVQQALSAQEQQIQEQQLQSKIQQLQGAIQGQAGQLFAAWKTPTQSYVEGVPPIVVQGPTGVTTVTQVTQKTKVSEAWIKAGTIKFGVLITALNSDEPGPILVRIVSDGEFKGARLIGQLTTFPPHGQKIMLMFNTMTLPNYPNSIRINAVAIDENTARTAISSFTNNHYLTRFGTMFAASFLQGYGQAFLQSGQNIVSTASSTQVTSPVLSSQGKLFVALGAVGNRFAQQLNQYFNIPPTVHVFSGASIGILFLDDLPPPQS